MLDYPILKKDPVSDSIQPEGRKPNVAFFFIVIQKIEEAEDLHLQHDLPGLIQKSGLHLPDHLSSLIRFIRRHVEKAFSKKQFSDLLLIPAPLQPKQSAVASHRLCKNAGISEQWLFDCDDIYTEQTTITIGLFLELIDVKKVKGVTDAQFSVWVQRLFNLEATPNAGAIRRQWERIVSRASKLRCKQKERDFYLQRPYLPPSKRQYQCSGPVTENDKSNYEKPEFSDSGNLTEFDSVSSQTCTKDTREMLNQTTQCEKFPSLAELATSAYINEQDTRNTEVKLVQSQLARLQEQVQCVTSQFDKIRKQVGHYNTKNVYKREKRAMATRENLAKCLKEIESLKSEVISFEKAKNNALKEKSKWKIRATAVDCDKCKAKDSKITQLHTCVQQLEFEKDTLSESLSSSLDLGSSKKEGTSLIKTREVRDGHVGYSDQIRLVYMKLLSLGVSVAKCSDVVRTVVNGITDLEIEKLPAKSTTSCFQSECETVAQMHVADVMMQNRDMTLSLDGTKKKFKEYGSFQITHSTPTSSINANGKETLSIGIQEMARGDTDSFLNTLSSVLKDLAETFSDDSETISEISAQMLVNIKNLMTDRHVVNKALKEKLEGFRKDLFEKHLKDFSTLPKDQQDQLVELHGLFCGLHVLANLGTAASKALKIYEEIALPESVKISEYSFNKGNSRTFDLVFEISQSLTVSGNQRFGRLADWEAFLDSLSEKNHIVSFLRHRFNILFVDGASIYYHRQHIADFLETLNGTNRLLLCIKESINSPVCVAALRALGIISVLITQPLWRVVERQDIHIFDLNRHWLHLELSLKDLSKDASELLEGRSVFPDFHFQAHKDTVYDELFRPVPPEVSNLTKECLELLCFHMHSLVTRQVEDQLPGGKYATPTPQVMEQTKSCPTSNRAGEKDFSDLDREVDRAPQRFTSHISGTVCFRNNKTWQYFRALPAERRRQLMVRAMKHAPLRRKKNRERQKEVRKQRKKLLDETRAKKEAKLQRALKTKAELHRRIEGNGGVWETDQSIKMGVARIKSNVEKIRALKDQLQYHRLRLKSGDKTLSLFRLSSGGVPFGIEELSQNLTAVLNMSSNGTSDPTPCTSTNLRPQEERLVLLASHLKLVKAKPPTKKKTKPVTKAAANLLKQAKRTVSFKRGATFESASPHVRTKRIKQSPTCPSLDVSFRYSEESLNQFVAVAFDNAWYLGQISQVTSPENAVIKYMKRVGHSDFQWPDPPDQKETSALYLIQKHITITPRDSGLRIWKVSSSADIDDKFKLYKAQYMDHGEVIRNQ